MRAGPGFTCRAATTVSRAGKSPWTGRPTPAGFPPRVTVQTEAPGLAPEQVEALVPRPVEGAMNGVGNLESIRSESIQGLSVITAVFQERTDIFVARQMLAEKLAELAGELPSGVKTPPKPPLTP